MFDYCPSSFSPCTPLFRCCTSYCLSIFRLKMRIWRKSSLHHTCNNSFFFFYRYSYCCYCFYTCQVMQLLGDSEDRIGKITSLQTRMRSQFTGSGKWSTPVPFCFLFFFRTLPGSGKLPVSCHCPLALFRQFPPRLFPFLWSSWYPTVVPCVRCTRRLPEGFFKGQFP
jgi:hypothetical protein